jgi:hypothetical protein
MDLPNSPEEQRVCVSLVSNDHFGVNEMVWVGDNQCVLEEQYKSCYSDEEMIDDKVRPCTFDSVSGPAHAPILATQLTCMTNGKCIADRFFKNVKILNTKFLHTQQ